MSTEVTSSERVRRNARSAFLQAADPAPGAEAANGDGASAEAPEELSVLTVGSLVRDRYKLSVRVAQGGMGTIWEAEDISLNRRVAIKLLLTSFSSDPTFRKRFELETRTTATLRSHNVVQVFDAGVSNNVPFIVMELLEGENLHELLWRGGPLPYDETLAVARGIGRGLGDAHRANIVHRDLKPTNVFIAEVGSSRIVKLVDFGVARIVSSAHRSTQKGVILESPSYMSPEQIKASHTIDHKSDLWSFGVLLYRCLSGRKPFEGTTNEILQKICNKTPPLFSSMMGHPSPDLDAFFERALRRNPSYRFGSAAEMVAAFKQAVSVDRLCEIDAPPPEVLLSESPKAAALGSSRKAEVANDGSHKEVVEVRGSMAPDASRGGGSAGKGSEARPTQGAVDARSVKEALASHDAGEARGLRQAVRSETPRQLAQRHKLARPKK